MTSVTVSFEMDIQELKMTKLDENVGNYMLISLIFYHFNVCLPHSSAVAGSKMSKSNRVFQIQVGSGHL